MKSVLVIDVSNNAPITLEQFKSSKACALICKATEGTSFNDQTLGSHRAIARQAKVPFGAYVFLHPGSQGNEAQDFLNYAKLRKGDIQPIIDTEVADGESMTTVAARVLSCAQYLGDKGYKPIIYASTSFWEQLVAEKREIRRYRVWEADYPGHYTRWCPWMAKWRARLGRGASIVLWQWTDSFAIGGRKYDASRLFVNTRSLLIS